MKKTRVVDYTACANYDKQSLRYLRLAIVATEQATEADTIEVKRQLHKSGILYRAKALSSLQQAIEEARGTR